MLDILDTLVFLVGLNLLLRYTEFFAIAQVQVDLLMYMRYDRSRLDGEQRLCPDSLDLSTLVISSSVFALYADKALARENWICGGEQLDTCAEPRY